MHTNILKQSFTYCCLGNEHARPSPLVVPSRMDRTRSNRAGSYELNGEFFPIEIAVLARLLARGIEHFLNALPENRGELAIDDVFIGFRGSEE